MIDHVLIRHYWKIYILLALICYAGAIETPFLFDDILGIVENPAIRSLWPIQNIMQVGEDETPWGRPVVCLSLALNYAVGDLNVRGYHLFNLSIHILSACFLFKLLQRLLEDLFFIRSTTIYLAFVISSLWLVHPLGTNVVTYTVQRAEGFMILFYILTLYYSIVVLKNPSYRNYSYAIVFCALGMSSKESMFTAPFAVMLLYSNVYGFSLKRQFKEKRILLMGLFSTWLLLALWMYLYPRNASVGTSLISSSDYFMMQWKFIWKYISLSFWPLNLCIDYMAPEVSIKEFWAYGLSLSIILIVSLWAAFIKKWKVFYSILFLFLVLGPTSSFVPIQTSVAAEHRFVLPLAALISFLVLLIYTVSKIKPKKNFNKIGFPLYFGILVFLGFNTIERNKVYQSTEKIWEDITQKQPKNARAWNNLGSHLILNGDSKKAIDHFEKALSLNPNLADAHSNIGLAFCNLKQFQKAIESLKKSIELEPNHRNAFLNLGVTASRMGKFDLAIKAYNQAIHLSPYKPNAYVSLATLFRIQGKRDKAMDLLKKALKIAPNYPYALKEQILLQRNL